MFKEWTGHSALWDHGRTVDVNGGSPAASLRTGTPTHVVPGRIITARTSRGAIMSEETAEVRRALQESLDRREQGSND